MSRRRIHAEPRRYWSPDEDAVLVARYPHEPTGDVARALPGRTLGSVYQRARTLDLSKTAAYLASPAAGRTDGQRGAACRFKPGHQPWNTGQHWVAGGRSAETRFQRGMMPHNHVPVGTRVKSSGGYWKVKVAEPKGWRWEHRMVWEQAHGQIPRGSAVVFRDGNLDNTALANLALVSRQALMRRNSVHNYPQPIPQLVQLRGAVVRKLNRRRSA